MKFMDLFDIESTVRVCDIISLFLIGGDDKIYFNLANSNENDYILKCERIISKGWEPYYECKIKWIEENCSFEPGLSYITLFV